MSKHRHSPKRQTQATPPSRQGEADRPRASGSPEPQPSAATKDPAFQPEPPGRPSPTHDQIAVRAYELWEAKGRPEGTDQEDWFEAERQSRAGTP